MTVSGSPSAKFPAAQGLRPVPRAVSPLLVEHFRFLFQPRAFKCAVPLTVTAALCNGYCHPLYSAEGELRLGI